MARLERREHRYTATPRGGRPVVLYRMVSELVTAALPRSAPRLPMSAPDAASARQRAAQRVSAGGA